MTTYVSKPHQIQAFRFNDATMKAPKWFLKAIETKHASVTLNGDKRYVTLYSRAGNIERAQWGDWVCINSSGKLFTISDEDFQEAYDVV